MTFNAYYVILKSEAIDMRSKSKNNVVGSVVVIIILGLIIAGAVYWAINNTGGFTALRGGPTQIMRSDIHRSSITDADGRPRTVEARIAFEIDNDVSNNINQQQLDRAIQNTLRRLNFEDITAADGFDYINDMLMETLMADPNINLDAVAGIYISEFAWDLIIPPDNIPTVNRPEFMFNRIFGNWR